MTMFDRILPVVLKFEGGYVNDPDDPGGATNQGITQKVYDAYRRSMGDSRRSVRSITDLEVAFIYEHNYWRDGKCDIIARTQPYLAAFHFDTCVNTGISQAARFLQRAVNASADGVIGPKTLGAINSSIEFETIEKYAELRNRFYRTLAKRRSTSLKFLRGWLVRVAHLEGHLHEWFGASHT